MKAVRGRVGRMQALRLNVINVDFIVVAATVLVKLKAHSTLLLTTKVVLVDLIKVSLRFHTSLYMEKMPAKSSPLLIPEVLHMPSDFSPRRHCT